jgi:hypothetical protein
MLCRKIVALFSEALTEHKIALCRHNLEYLNIKPAGTQSLHLLGFKVLTCLVNILGYYSKILDSIPVHEANLKA